MNIKKITPTFEQLKEYRNSDLVQRASNLNYGQINILADADLDGYSIVGLLINFFKQWPELFERNIINVVCSPILKAEYKKETLYYYTISDYENDRDSGKIKKHTITYLKGLGSLTEDAYQQMIHNPVKFSLDDITNEDLESLEVVYGDSSDKRKEWLMT